MVLRATVLKVVTLLAISDIHCQYMRPVKDTWPWVSYASSTSEPVTESTAGRATTPSSVGTSAIAPRLGTSTTSTSATETTAARVTARTTTPSSIRASTMASKATTSTAETNTTFATDLDLDAYVSVKDPKTNREYWIPRDQLEKLFRNKGKVPKTLELPASGSHSKRGAYSSGYYSYNHNHNHNHNVQQTGSSGSSAYPGLAGSPCKHRTNAGHGWHYVGATPSSAVPCSSTNCQNTHRHHHKCHRCGSHSHKMPNTGPVTPRPQYPRSSTTSYVNPYVPGRTPGTRKPTTAYPTKWRPTTTESSTEKQTTSVPKTSTSTKRTTTTSIPTSRTSTTTQAPPTAQTTDSDYPDEYWDLNITPAR